MPQGQYTAADVDRPKPMGQYSAADVDHSGWVPDPEPPSSSGWVPDPDETAPKRTWLDSATDFAKGLWNQVNPVAGVKGAAQLAADPVGTYKQDAASRQDILDKAEAAFKKGDYAGGVAHALNGIIPFLGPQMDQAGEEIQNGQSCTGTR